MQKIRLGGVPEHFNLPIHWAIEEGAFQKAGFDIEWTDYPQGTGAMMSSLDNKEQDIVIALTEGVVKAIHAGSKAKLARFYTASPLIWGVHTAADTSFETIRDLEGKRFAISRNGSGSHLMAIVMAEQYGWNREELEFVIVDTLEGARQALKEGKADGFLWEHFTTKPLVDSGEFKHLGDFLSPWPCFVFAVAPSLQEDSTQLKAFFEVVSEYANKMMYHPQAVPFIAERYQLKEEDVRVWFGKTRWMNNNSMPKALIDEVESALLSLELIEEPKGKGQICLFLG